MELSEIRVEVKQSQETQNAEWNQGLRQLREDLHRGRESLRDDIHEMLAGFVTKDVFIARLSPVQSVAYSLVALLMVLLTGLLASALAFRKG